jgi:adenylyl-sulfate kinase
MSNEGFVLWFTGLSGSGKSTLAARVGERLRALGKHVEILDGDEVRENLTRGLGFSREDRDTNVRRIGYVARVVARCGAVAITAAISPYRGARDEQRAQSPRFVEVFCRCDLQTLTDRDPKGLYRKALAGELKGFTGVDDPYEEPLAPEIVVDTGILTVEEATQRVLDALHTSGMLIAYRDEVVAERGTRSSADLSADRSAMCAVRRACASGDETLPTIRVSETALAWLVHFACGTLAPLTGFMTEREMVKVRAVGELERGRAWRSPVLAEVVGPLPQLEVHSYGALVVGDARQVADLAGAPALLGRILISEVNEPGTSGAAGAAGVAGAAGAAVAGPVEVDREGLVAWLGALPDATVQARPGVAQSAVRHVVLEWQPNLAALLPGLQAMGETISVLSWADAVAPPAFADARARVERVGGAALQAIVLPRIPALTTDEEEALSVQIAGAMGATALLFADGRLVKI